MKEAKNKFSIPGTLNLFVSIILSFACILLLLLASRQNNWLAISGIAIAFGVMMIPVYTLIHEAEHNILHSNRHINNFLGRWLSCFFIAPFSFIKHCHLKHHKNNRTDMEMWDLYYEHQDKRDRFRRLYIVILTGHLSIVLSVLLFTFWPNLLYSNLFTYREETAAFLEGSNTKKKIGVFRFESVGVIVFHVTCFLILKFHWLPWLLCYIVHSFMWSTQNYVSHAFSPRDIINGAHNLKLPHPLRIFYLNFNLHLAHHQNPKIPWVYLPAFIKDDNYRISYFRNYIRLWKGPVLTIEHDPSKRQKDKYSDPEKSILYEHQHQNS